MVLHREYKAGAIFYIVDISGYFGMIPTPSHSSRPVFPLNLINPWCGWENLESKKHRITLKYVWWVKCSEWAINQQILYPESVWISNCHREFSMHSSPICLVKHGLQIPELASRWHQRRIFRGHQPYYQVEPCWTSIYPTHIPWNHYEIPWNHHETPAIDTETCRGPAASAARHSASAAALPEESSRDLSGPGSAAGISRWL